MVPFETSVRFSVCVA